MKNFKPRFLLKPYFIIPLAIIVLIACLFIFWALTPSRSISVAIVDKTVPATAADSHSYLDDVSNNYRKHIGLDWLLDYMKIVNPASGEPYSESADYYGPKLDQDNVIIGTDSIIFLDDIPDILYLCDTYGVELLDDHGISTEEMNMISLCRSSGSVIIGEQDILTTGTGADVRGQLERIFGVTTTGWVGRYIFDLQDMTDVPYWAPPMWEQKYGQEWKLSGPGILFVSRDGDILVLEEKTDFQSKNLMKISTEKDYRKEFGKRSMNYYNWFELIEADYGTEVFATYSFNVNAVGAEKMSIVSDTTTFAAATRKKVDGSSPAYYFAGDFNDYVTKKQISCFCFADIFFRALSFDREGDVTNFYWNFYEPVMKKIISDAAGNPLVRQEKEYSQVARVSENGLFQIMSDGEWQDFELKGVNINGETPGSDRYEYSRDYNFYVSLISTASQMGANCIRTYDLLPPEFYRALYENNSGDGEPLYLIQGISSPHDLLPEDSVASLDRIYARIDAALSALHGGGMIKTDDGEAAYVYDLSPYTIAYIVDPGIDGGAADRIMNGVDRGYAYTGEYLTCGTNAPEALNAALCDYTLTRQNELYGCMNPVSVCFGADRLSGVAWTAELTRTFNPSRVTVADEAKELYFTSLSLNTDDAAVWNTPQLAEYSDQSGQFAYGGYIEAAKKVIDGAVLIDRVGLSTNSDMFEKTTQINGLSEKEQGDGLVRILRNAAAQGYMGALIADLNDNWSALSDEMAPYTIPLGNNGLWHNTADRAQTTGLVAADAIMPSEVNMELNDSGAMSQMQLSVNEAYVYMTLVLASEIDYDKQELIVGIDTYQRNNGEYYYDKGYFANSLSGMEYIVKFESRQAAALYVAESYNRNNNNYISAESYSASYDLVSVLNYGDFQTSNTHFYQTGMTIHIRLPWVMLNFTDPSNHLVINGTNGTTLLTTATEGMIFSLLIGDKTTKDTAYIFPSSKQQAGYKTLKLSGWDETTVKYNLREKRSVAIIKRYFTKG